MNVQTFLREPVRRGRITANHNQTLVQPEPAHRDRMTANHNQTLIQPAPAV